LHQLFNCSETVPVVHTQAPTPTGCVFGGLSRGRVGITKRGLQSQWNVEVVRT